ncbi:hypothetical protein KYG_08855 [Acidovorax sp. NO-1]|uniref:DUF2783 domain-containing protein n=1 Tax=Acidovorax sp. NO-1 TaxID=512030 RepID=UPI00023FD235|nr:DUF2783 domain-containing protein [Acidovorax sp. NO-1]EHL23347.1 hypothetical protein KYG_08855 [Acidovorax sp. NO-1]
MLITHPHLQASDDFYEALLTAHEGLSTEESHAMNARLVLLLANHIGDQDTLTEALSLARGRAQGRTAQTPAAPAAIAPVAPVHAAA